MGDLNKLSFSFDVARATPMGNGYAFDRYLLIDTTPDSARRQMKALHNHLLEPHLDRAQKLRDLGVKDALENPLSLGIRNFRRFDTWDFWKDFEGIDESEDGLIPVGLAPIMTVRRIISRGSAPWALRLMPTHNSKKAFTHDDFGRITQFADDLCDLKRDPGDIFTEFTRGTSHR